MLDRILEIGSFFDWITPVAAEIQDLANGPSHTFLIPEEAGGSGREICRILREHGVKYWGLMVVDHIMMLTVRKSQSWWADYLLQREGIPLLNAITSGHVTTAARQTAGHAAKSGMSRRHDIVDDIGGLVDSVAHRLRL